MARTPGSKNKPKSVPIYTEQDVRDLNNRITKLEGLTERQDEAVQQGLDEISELRDKVEFYRKQVNHLMALLNILTKGA
jgi:uncharacterized coiled-coil protein SlyX